MIEKLKTKAIAAKHQETRREISLFSKKEKNYKSNTKNKINLHQANDKYSLPN